MDDTSIDSSGLILPTQNRREKVGKRKFGGPAGLMPPLANGLQAADLSVDEVKEMLQHEFYLEHFCTTGPWQTMKRMLTNSSQILKEHNIKNILSKVQSYTEKVPFREDILTVLVRTIDTSHNNQDAYLEVEDGTGTIGVALHRDVIREYPRDICEHSVLVLRNFVVFCARPNTSRNLWTCYLNICPRNLEWIFSETKNSGTDSNANIQDVQVIHRPLAASENNTLTDTEEDSGSEKRTRHDVVGVSQTGNQPPTRKHRHEMLEMFGSSGSEDEGGQNITEASKKACIEQPPVTTDRHTLMGTDAFLQTHTNKNAQNINKLSATNSFMNFSTGQRHFDAFFDNWDAGGTETVEETHPHSHSNTKKSAVEDKSFHNLCSFNNDSTFTNIQPPNMENDSKKLSCTQKFVSSNSFLNSLVNKKISENTISSSGKSHLQTKSSTPMPNVLNKSCNHFWKTDDKGKLDLWDDDFDIDF